ncbi:hypothetical protein GF312_00590 [Candidatus Poribacteria bacterium]|nr:hypothetical protein [Candidatus Poribacteria bacterium]
MQKFTYSGSYYNCWDTNNHIDMKTRVDINSLETYEQIRDQLPKKRKIVFELIWTYKDKGLTAFDIAAMLNVGVNHVTGRINELMHLQVIRKKGIDTTSKQPRAKYTIRFEGQPLNEFSKCLEDRIDEFWQEFDSIMNREKLRPVQLMSNHDAVEIFVNQIKKLGKQKGIL